MGRLSRLASLGIVLAGALAATAVAAQSQETTDPAMPTDPAEQAAPAKQKQPVPWSSSCASAGRGLPLECALEQRAIARETKQVIGTVTIRVPPDTKKPVIMIRVPHGLFLPSGLTVDVDGDMAQNYPLQTCNANGCFAGFPLSDQMLARMQKGGKLNVIFQYLDKKPVTLPMSLTGFIEAYGRIK